MATDQNPPCLFVLRLSPYDIVVVACRGLVRYSPPQTAGMTMGHTHDGARPLGNPCQALQAMYERIPQEGGQRRPLELW